MGNTFEEKKQLVIRYLPLGMSLEDAMFYAEMTENEIERAQADEVFDRKVRYKLLSEQERLLKKFDEIIQNNAAENKSGDLLYKLGLLDPKRFGNAAQKAAADNKPNGGMTINITISKKTASLDQDNVEIYEGTAKLDELGIGDDATSLKKE
jgi:hypothetical protein